MRPLSRWSRCSHGCPSRNSPAGTAFGVVVWGFWVALAGRPLFPTRSWRLRRERGNGYNPPMLHASEIPLSRRRRSNQAWIPFIVFLLLGVQEGHAQTGVNPAERDDVTVVAFVNVAIVSMQNEALLEGHTVVIQGQRICVWATRR